MAIDSGYIITPISGKKGTDGQNGKNGTGISVQYSVNGTENWHDTFGNGDIYMRQSTNGGTTWSAAMRIVGEKGDKGDTGAQGAKGDTGTTGPQGPKGDKGDTYTVGCRATTFDYMYSEAAGLFIYGNLVGAVYSRGHNIWVINKDTLTVIEFKNYDTYGNPEYYCNAMADYLNGLQDCIVVIASSDAISVTQTLRVALARLGANPTGTIYMERTTHYVIGVPGMPAGSGYELMSGYLPASIQVPVILGKGIVANGVTGPQGPKGDTGAIGNYTKRIPLYCITTSTIAPAAPTSRVTATGTATTTTWTQGKYTSYAVGNYYYTCEQVESYNSAGTYLSCTWTAVSRDTEYENAGTARLRAEGRYIGKKSTAFTAYTPERAWDWFLAEKSFTVNGVSVTEGNVYVWNGSTWIKDNDSSHLAAAMNDMIALIDTYTTNSTSVGAFATVFAQTMAAKSAFINSLFAKKILIQTNGIIRGGSRYNDSGAVVDASKNGFWISADGTIKGNLQGDFFDSVIIGTNAGKKLTDNSETGSSKASVLIGTGAGANATTASLNTFVGTGAGSNVNGSMNTYIGHQAGQGSGDSATGTQNVAVGKSAGNSITTGANNTYLGTAAGYYQKTGSNNVVVGDEAYMQSTAASGNVVIGAKAANNATLGDDNIIIGRNAAFSSKTWGQKNILIGAFDPPNYNNDTVPTETINIGGKLFYVPKFSTGNSGLFPGKAIPAFLFEGALFDISADSSLKFARLYGVVEQSFNESFGYIKYANGLLIQWGVITSSGTFAFPSAYKNRPFFVGIGRSEADGSVDYDEIAHAISETEYRLKYHYSDVDWLAIGVSS